MFIMAADYLKKLESHIAALDKDVEVTIDGEVVTVKLPDQFIATLPDGLTEEIVKTYETHKAQFVAASVQVVGRYGNAEFVAHPDAKRVEAHVPLYKNQAFDVIGHRESGEGKSRRFGDYMIIMNTAVEDGGTLAKVFKHLSADAKATYGSTDTPEVAESK
jgi:hypothetical protein